jgi:GTP cyclohydrolase FolE2
VLPDIQSQADERELPIDAVGVKGVRHPVTIRSGGRSAATVADFAMSVALPARHKGTHMSRFIELLESHTGALGFVTFESLTRAMLWRLDAASGAIDMCFTWFLEKSAPVSAVRSRLDLPVRWQGSVDTQGRYRFRMSVTVPVTSLCPCSKEISAYGAHNQRSHIRIEAGFMHEMAIDALAALAERNASSEVYGLLKRPDEKYVTERAYENPKFAEDLVRDVALDLRRQTGVSECVVEAENFESIHNHSAYARIGQAG